jgi:hypothetical protein
VEKQRGGTEQQAPSSFIVTPVSTGCAWQIDDLRFTIYDLLITDQDKVSGGAVPLYNLGGGD